MSDEERRRHDDDESLVVEELRKINDSVGRSASKYTITQLYLIVMVTIITLIKILEYF